MKRRTLFLATLATLLLTATAAEAFCGFYVGRAGAQLFNQASQVVLVRDDNRTVLTMSNDFQGPLTDFAAVFPVPTFIEREQIHVGDMALIDHLDAFTAPRLVEYHDDNPCQRLKRQNEMVLRVTSESPMADLSRKALGMGVRIEASYTVGEYDISILSADDSHGLVRWLKANGYSLPRGAEATVGSYLKQGMRFFVAKVNLDQQEKLGYRKLRPLQVAYESRKFMLPIRLGTVNADGPQELFLYTLTRNGRVETTNYRTVKLPTGDTIPTFVRDDFGRFYRAMFDEQVKRERMGAVFLEYAWDMNWCDPCAADPLSADQLRQLGVFWLGGGAANRGRPQPVGGAQNVFVTRLHVRYDAETFPEDLHLQETGDRTNFQGRYVLQNPWTGSAQCDAGRDYFEVELPRRREQEARTLASLTGWDLGEIRRRNGLRTAGSEDNSDRDPWWKRIWGR